jgi:transcriptional regulator with XRE-family HTH domain
VIIVFYEQLKKLCNQNNITPTELIKSFNMSSGNLGSWKNGGMPSIEILQKIAKYFNVSTDYLLCNEPFTPVSNDINHNEIESAINNEIRDLDKETKKDVLSYIKFKKQQKD